MATMWPKKTPFWPWTESERWYFGKICTLSNLMFFNYSFFFIKLNVHLKTIAFVSIDKWDYANDIYTFVSSFCTTLCFIFDTIDLLTQGLKSLLYQKSLKSAYRLYHWTLNDRINLNRKMEFKLMIISFWKFRFEPP